MRRWMKAGMVGLAAVVLTASGCSKKQEDGAAETEAQSEAAAETAGADAEADRALFEDEELVEEGSITLGEYKGIPVTVQKASVTDEEIESLIQYYLNGSATYEEVDRAAQLSDQVNIDFKGIQDGEAFDGGTAEGYDLVLGSGRFIDGFEGGLVGAKKGDELSLDLTFPDPYPNNPDLAGKPVVFEVKVNSVKEKTIPELTDEFVAGISPETKTVEEFRQMLRDTALEARQTQSDNQRDTDLVNAVIEASEIVCSTADIDESYEMQLNAYTNMASQYGMDLDTYAMQMGMDLDTLKKQLREAARSMAKQEMVLKEIAAKENLTVDESDEEALAIDYGYESREAILANDNVTEEMLTETALMQKALDFLVEHAVITEEEPEIIGGADGTTDVTLEAEEENDGETESAAADLN